MSESDRVGATAGHRNRCWGTAIAGTEAWSSVWTRQPQNRHSHDAIQISLTQAGRGRIRSHGRAYEVGSGQLVILPADCVHELEPLGIEAWEFETIYLPAEIAEVDPGKIAAPQSSPTLVAAVRRLHAAIVTGRDRLELDTAVEALRSQLNRQTGVQERPIAPTRLLRRIRERLLDDLEADVTLQQLAELAGVAPAHLNRSFRMVYGLPPHAFRLQARINRARNLLQAGMPIAATAAATGFVDQPHMTRHFKRLVGLTPGSYARQIKNVQDVDREGS